MGDRGGLLVMLGIAVLLVMILLVMRPRRHGGGDVEHETLNPEVEAAGGRPVALPDTDRLVGSPPVDTVSASGEGTAVAGAGAGGETADVRDPLRARPDDVAGSPDQA
ncbi:hypothetical protein GCM10009868_25240 [Terrabacter aerolatus]|uniref:Uncharacterized protein n=1 Tax=Terrabacter aerolatus TaxID=422442 RepID=A0A512D184_9MICO|nr:hypothetical protein [Terrabacter aerolatus]GEO30211.1 hypothetical protein TAE01_20210 [Terrabacter aerolatus]